MRYSAPALARPCTGGNVIARVYGLRKDILARPAGTIHALARPSGQVVFYPAPTADVAYIKVFVHFTNEPPSAARYVGTYKPGAAITVPHNPASDKDLVVRAISYSATGTPDVSDIADSVFAIVRFNREDLVPVISKIGSSTETLIQISVTNFTKFAFARRVEYATNVGFTAGIVDTIVDGAGKPLTYQANATRPHVTSQPSLDIWIRVSHSSTGPAGPWGPVSAALMATFQADGGTDGSPGDGGPTPIDHVPFSV